MRDPSQPLNKKTVILSEAKKIAKFLAGNPNIFTEQQ
jgi:hypothetical protein